MSVPPCAQSVLAPLCDIDACPETAVDLTWPNDSPSPRCANHKTICDVFRCGKPAVNSGLAGFHDVPPEKAQRCTTHFFPKELNAREVFSRQVTEHDQLLNQVQAILGAGAESTGSFRRDDVGDVMLLISTESPTVSAKEINARHGKALRDMGVAYISVRRLDIVEVG